MRLALVVTDGIRATASSEHPIRAGRLPGQGLGMRGSGLRLRAEGVGFGG